MKKISLALEIYTYQIDFIGHVNSSVYLQWLEIGRLKLLEAVGLPIHEIAKRGFVPVVIDTNISYKAPLYLGDAVQMELWISELKHASAIINFHLYNGSGSLAVEAYQKGLFIDRVSKRPRRLMPEERELFNPYVFSKSSTTLSGALSTLNGAL
jgi:acyl-CoA thioester hydrolase